MASNAEMLRLVTAAADLLKSDREKHPHGMDPSTVGAMSYAQAILRMVAACMMDDPPSLAGVTVDGYDEWAAAQNDAIGMSRAEVSSVLRYVQAQVTS